MALEEDDLQTHPPNSTQKNSYGQAMTILKILKESADFALEESLVHIDIY